MRVQQRCPATAMLHLQRRQQLHRTRSQGSVRSLSRRSAPRPPSPLRFIRLWGAADDGQLGVGSSELLRRQRHFATPTRAPNAPVSRLRCVAAGHAHTIMVTGTSVEITVGRRHCFPRLNAAWQIRTKFSCVGRTRKDSWASVRHHPRRLQARTAGNAPSRLQHRG